jgi:predicted metalloprotease
MTTHEGTFTKHRVRKFVAALTATTLAGLLALATGAGVAQAQVGKTYDASVDETIADIQSYWTKTMPDVYGMQYEAIPTNRVYPYSSSNPPPNCDDGGRTTTPYQQIAGNAFYCSNGDFVAYDEEGLIPKLRQQYGEFAVGLVFAHELGHAIQARVNYNPGASVYLEQQADCFAGSWAQHVATSTDANVHLSKDDLDTALAGLLALRDPSGIDGSQDGAHGNGFDRVSAFQDGYEGGAKACADYQQHPPTVTESAYTSQSDYDNNGNLSMSELLPLVEDSMKSYWTNATTKFTGTTKIVAGNPVKAADSCSGGNGNGSDQGALSDAAVYCAATDTVTYDAQQLAAEHDSIGDFAPAVLLATEYAASVQHALGRDVQSAAGRSASVCLAGAWAADVGGQTADSSGTNSGTGGSSSLSPGDLDEAVKALVASPSGAVDRGSAFDRVSAFRTGFHDGASACVSAATASTKTTGTKTTGTKTHNTKTRSTKTHSTKKTTQA